MKLLKKIKREFIAGISKIYLGHVKSDYLGLKLKVPLIYGMRNGGYIIPAELWMSYCLESFIKTKNGCIIDIGVNVGLYLVKLKAISDKIDYYGIDPNPACIFYTKELVRINNFKKSKLFTVALSDRSEIVDFYTNSTHSDKKGSLIKSHHIYDDEFSFSTITMKGDNLVDMLKIDQISAIKIDVEGAEFNALKGMKNIIKKYNPYVFIEILPAGIEYGANDALDICQFMQDMDYLIVGIHLKSQKTEVIQNINEIGAKYEDNYAFVPSNYLKAFINHMKKIHKPC